MPLFFTNIQLLPGVDSSLVYGPEVNIGPSVQFVYKIAASRPPSSKKKKKKTPLFFCVLHKVEAVMLLCHPL